eukprot:GDKI01036152.1.p1 GENE.GDKI01036152.1~~GDKI01036152.1.p1  ORF type:complete len:109 (+),score=23.88 GDKI01036152.1:46-372(+)
MYELLQPENAAVLHKLQGEAASVLKEKRHPSQEDIGKLTYLQACIKETLRKWPVATNLPRKVPDDADLDLGECIIPRGSSVMIPIFAIHRSELYVSRACMHTICQTGP